MAQHPQTKESVLYNGQLLPRSELKLTPSRGLYYGDGLLEAIRIHKGKVCWAQLHTKRMLAGCKAIGLELPTALQSKQLAVSLEALCTSNTMPEARVRISLWRGGAAGYLPHTAVAHFLAEASPMPEELYGYGPRIAGVYVDASCQPSPWSAYKRLSAMLYVQAARWADQHDLDEALLLGPNDQLGEGSRTNVLLLINGKVVTPHLESGCVAGVLRKAVLQTAFKLGIPTEERAVPLQELKHAEEVWLANSMIGLQGLRQLSWGSQELTFGWGSEALGTLQAALRQAATKP